MPEKIEIKKTKTKQFAFECGYSCDRSQSTYGKFLQAELETVAAKSQLSK